jgi:ketopantoate reductase
MMSKTVGVVGLGAMGSAMALMLVKAGFDVVGFDVREAALDELESNGGKRADSPRDVAEKSDVVLLSFASIGGVEHQPAPFRHLDFKGQIGRLTPRNDFLSPLT